MNTDIDYEDMEEIEVSIPYILTDDFYTRDEWCRQKVLFNRGDKVYGNQNGDYIVARILNANVFIPKTMTKAPDLKCEGWSGECDSNDAWKGHMNTRYVDEERNYATLCPSCWKECEEHWKDMWADYYNNCM
jgi:hypothetical protein